jgi:hypothetical protein
VLVATGLVIQAAAVLVERLVAVEKVDMVVAVVLVAQARVVHQYLAVLVVTLLLLEPNPVVAAVLVTPQTQMPLMVV